MRKEAQRGASFFIRLVVLFTAALRHTHALAQMALFASYEHDFGVYIADITRKIGLIPDLTGGLEAGLHSAHNRSSV